MLDRACCVDADAATTGQQVRTPRIRQRELAIRSTPCLRTSDQGFVSVGRRLTEFKHAEIGGLQGEGS